MTQLPSKGESRGNDGDPVSTIIRHDQYHTCIASETAAALLVVASEEGVANAEGGRGAKIPDIPLPGGCGAPGKAAVTSAAIGGAL